MRASTQRPHRDLRGLCGSHGWGECVGCFAPVPQRLIAAIMAFGAKVPISALSFDLMDEAYRRGD